MPVQFNSNLNLIQQNLRESGHLKKQESIIKMRENKDDNALTFSKHFILVRVAVNPEPIPGNHGREVGIYPGWEASPSQHTMHTQIHTLIRT